MISQENQLLALQIRLTKEIHIIENQIKLSEYKEKLEELFFQLSKHKKILHDHLNQIQTH